MLSGRLLNVDHFDITKKIIYEQSNLHREFLIKLILFKITEVGVRFFQARQWGGIHSRNSAAEHEQRKVSPGSQQHLITSSVIPLMLFCLDCLYLPPNS